MKGVPKTEYLTFKKWPFTMFLKRVYCRPNGPKLFKINNVISFYLSHPRASARTQIQQYTNVLIFLRDFIFQNKLNMKNYKIKTKTTKSLMEEKILSGTK